MIFSIALVKRFTDFCRDNISTRSGSTTNSIIIVIAFLSLSSSLERTSERICSTSVLSLAISASCLDFSSLDISHADMGAVIIAAMTGSSMVKRFIMCVSLLDAYLL